MSAARNGHGDAIVAEGLTKTFGETQALKGIDLRVPTGTVLGLLGPNGAGKTTTVRILTTLLRPDAGRAEVAGVDVLANPELARSRMGLTGQYAAVDEVLTGRENLVMFGQLYRLTKAAAVRRADELLERFTLSDAADRVVRTYSGGMRRRLDLAASLIVSPPVIFLDEPTTGLDPRSRNGMWEVIRDLVRDGTTVLLTTQYLEEADQLADNIAVIDLGRVIAEGTADTLKTQVGGERLAIRIAEDAELVRAADALRRIAAASGQDSDDVQVDRDSRQLTVPFTGGAKALPRAVRELDEAGIELADLSLRRPTLDDVFLSLTGRSTDDGIDPEPTKENAA